MREQNFNNKKKENHYNRIIKNKFEIIIKK